MLTCAACSVCLQTVQDGWLPPGAYSAGSCPVGVELSSGDAVSFISDTEDQGSMRSNGVTAACVESGICGAPYSAFGLGGGWQLCFA